MNTSDLNVHVKKIIKMNITQNTCMTSNIQLFFHFRPLSGSVLVVGCDGGLFVWTVDPSSPILRSVLHVNKRLLVQGTLEVELNLF